MRRLKIVAGLLLFLGIALAIVWILVLPWYVRKRIIEEAATRGVELQLGDVSLGLSSATVSGVTARATKVPGVTLTAGRVDVALHRFQPEAVTIANASIDIDGKAGDVATSIDAFLTSQPKGVGEGVAPPITVQNARIEWRRAFGDQTILHVGDLGGDVKGNPLGSDAAFHFSSITTDIGLASMGPWSGTLSRDKDKSSVSLALSSKGPDVAKLQVTRPINGESFTLDAKVSAPVALADLGFPKAILSLVSLEDGIILVDATHTEDQTTGHGSVKKLRLEGFRLSRATAPTILEAVDVDYGGPLEKMSIARGRVKVGPLSGPLDGAIARPRGGLAVVAHTKTDVMTCSDALKQQSSQLIGQQATGFIDDVGRTLGLDRHLDGTVTADARWTFDSRDPVATKLEVAPTATCDLSFLPK
jgi:hypothetical protein